MRHASLVILSLFAAASLFAAPPENAQRRDSVVRLEPAAFRAAIDPATGRLRQLTPEEARQLSASFMKSLHLKPVVPRVQSNGTISVELDDSSMNYYMARVTEEGVVTFNCVNDPSDAVALLIG